MTKEDLFEVVWPGVFVGDAALKVAIREVRRALGDDPRTPRFIETAHRRGYRFIARVERRVDESSEDNARAAVEGRRESSTPPSPVVAADAGTLVAGHARQVVAPGGVPPTHYARSGDVNIAYQVRRRRSVRSRLRDGMGLAPRVLLDGAVVRALPAPARRRSRG